MLVLSGGVLSGWTKAGTRPAFKVVTGVSTGSLQATFALLALLPILVVLPGRKSSS